MKKVKNAPFVVPFIGCFKTTEYCFVIMKFMNRGSLYNLLFNEKFKFTDMLKLKILRQVAIAMKCLHTKTLDRNAIVHRDLTLHNLLISDNLDCYLGDFGIAVEKPHSRTNELKLSPVGHPRYRPPEVSKNQLTSKRCDVYNFGNVMYELLGEIPLFAELDEKEIAKKTMVGILPNLNVLRKKNVPEFLITLLQRCWNMDPKKRPQFVEIVSLLEQFGKQYN